MTGDNGSALVVASNAEVVIYIPAGVSLTCRGSDAKSYLAPGQPGILLPKGSSLYVTGAGYLTASGGSAGNGGDGGSGQGAFLSGSGSNSTKTMYGGIGGVGGMGGPVLVLVWVHQEGKEEVEVCQEIRCVEFVAQFPMDIRMESAVKTGGMGRIPLM